MKRTLSTLIGVGLTLAGALGMLQLVRGNEPALSWLGLTLAALPPMVCVILDLQPAADEPRPALGYTVLSGLGLAVAMSQSWRYGPAAGWVHIWAGAAFVSWVVYARFLRVR